MNTPIITLVYDRRKRASAKVEGSIEMRITYNRVQRYVTTGVKVLPRQWKAGSVVNHPDSFELQRALDTMVHSARNLINELVDRGALDMATISERIIERCRASSSENVPGRRRVLPYIKERSEIRKYGRSKDSQDRYDRFVRWLEDWGGIVTFDDINDANVIRMDERLKLSGMKDNSRWHNYHRFLNSFILDAMEEGLLKRNPYKSVNIKKCESKDGLQKYLTIGEFRRIEELNPPTTYLEHVRDLFIFQVYTCMAYVDMAAFDSEKIQYINGRPMYDGKRGKTAQQFSFLLLRPAMDILGKYHGHLPIMSNQKYNDQLKVLASMAHISKPLSSHWARHTGATMLLNSGVDMEIVARVLGHSSTRMTRSVYAKLLDSTVVDAMAAVERKITK